MTSGATPVNMIPAGKCTIPRTWKQNAVKPPQLRISNFQMTTPLSRVSIFREEERSPDSEPMIRTDNLHPNHTLGAKESMTPSPVVTINRGRDFGGVKGCVCQRTVRDSIKWKRGQGLLNAYNAPHKPTVIQLADTSKPVPESTKKAAETPTPTRPRVVTFNIDPPNFAKTQTLTIPKYISTEEVDFEEDKDLSEENRC